MTDDEWAEKYKPKAAPVQGSGFSFGEYDTLLDGFRPEEIEVLKETPNECVWTVIDGDDGGTWIVSGFHLVNRIGHIITEESFLGDFIQIRMED